VVEATEHDGAEDPLEHATAHLTLRIATVAEDDVAPDVVVAIASETESLLAAPLAAEHRVALAAAAERRAATVVAIITAAEDVPRIVATIATIVAVVIAVAIIATQYDAGRQLPLIATNAITFRLAPGLLSLLLPLPLRFLLLPRAVRIALCLGDVGRRESDRCAGRNGNQPSCSHRHPPAPGARRAASLRRAGVAIRHVTSR